MRAPDRSAMIRKIDRLIFSKDRIIVFDKASKNILAFNKNGDFVASTANMIGRGHNEYIQLADIAFDKERDEVCAFSNNPYAILVFDTDLNLKRKADMDFWVLEMAVDDKYIYCLRRSKEEAIKSELIAFEKDNPGGEARTILKTEKGVIGLRGFGNSLNICNDTLYACMPFDNCIYKVANGKASVVCQLDFGRRAAKSLYDNLTYRKFLKENDDHDWMVMDINVYDSTIHFKTNSYYNFIFNKVTEECNAFRGITTARLPIHCSQIIPAQGLSRRTIFKTSNKSLKNYIEHNQHQHNKETDSTLIDAIETNNGNPILIIWKNKQD